MTLSWFVFRHTIWYTKDWNESQSHSGSNLSQLFCSNQRNNNTNKIQRNKIAKLFSSLFSVFHFILGLSFQVFLYIFLSWLFHSIHFIWHFLVELLVVVLWRRSKLFWLNAFHQMLLPFIHSLIHWFTDSLIRCWFTHFDEFKLF